MSRHQGRLRDELADDIWESLVLWLSENGRSPRLAFTSLKRGHAVESRMAALRWLLENVQICRGPGSNGHWQCVINGERTVGSTKLTTPEIGWLLNCDHSTVVLAKRRLEVQESPAV